MEDRLPNVGKSRNESDTSSLVMAASKDVFSLERIINADVILAWIAVRDGFWVSTRNIVCLQALLKSEYKEGYDFREYLWNKCYILR